MMDSDDGPCTDCWDTGLTTQTERPCSCDAGDQHRAKPAPPMTDDLVGRIKASVTYEYMPMKVRRQLSEAAARIEALEGEKALVRMMLADLHAATLTIATPEGSHLDEAREKAAAYFQKRGPHAD